MKVQRLCLMWTLAAIPMTGQLQSTPPPRLFIFDLVGDGRAFTSASGGVRFDLDGDGKPGRTGWTRRNSDDSFLFLDGNGNGIVDSARELSGSAWVTPDGQGVLEAGMSLFLMQEPSLKLFPGASLPSSVMRINQDDEVYPRLRMWADRNHNGISEPGELKPLHEARLLEVDTLLRRYPSPVRDASGNETQLEGTFRIRDGPRVVERRMGLVRFATE